MKGVTGEKDRTMRYGEKTFLRRLLEREEKIHASTVFGSLNQLQRWREESSAHPPMKARENRRVLRGGYREDVNPGN